MLKSKRQKSSVQNRPKDDCLYRPKDTYAGKGILEIFLDVFFGESQMHRLHLYYCYQLGMSDT